MEAVVTLQNEVKCSSGLWCIRRDSLMFLTMYLINTGQQKHAVYGEHNNPLNNNTNVRQ